MALLDAVTTVLELAAVVAVVVALLLAAVLLGSPWGWPVGLAAVAVSSSSAAVVLHVRGDR